MLIHAHWGLGEALVGGEADGDEYLLAEDATDSWRVLSCRLGGKAQQRRCADGGGTELRATPLRRPADRCWMPPRLKPWPHCCATPLTRWILSRRFTTWNGYGTARALADPGPAGHPPPALHLPGAAKPAGDLDARQHLRAAARPAGGV